MRWLLRGIRLAACRAGLAVAQRALEAYLLVSSEAVPPSVRASLAAALLYLATPLDAVSDFTPGVGYMDDLAVLTAALAFAHKYMTPEIEQRARLIATGLLKKCLS